MKLGTKNYGTELKDYKIANVQTIGLIRCQKILSVLVLLR